MNSMLVFAVIPDIIPSAANTTPKYCSGTPICSKVPLLKLINTPNKAANVAPKCK